MSYIGKSPSGSGVRTRYYFTQSSGGGTSISGTDDNGKTLTYTDGEYVDVYLNGVLLVHGTDYGTGTANTISSLAALASGDVVEVVVYDIYNVAKINNEAVRKRYYKTASGSETSISGADDSGATITFPANAEIEVKLNGVALVQGTDYNTTTANTVGGLSALSAGQVVEIVVYERFVLGDTVSKADGGTFLGSVGFSGGIGGDVSFDTDTLHVDATNNSVGIGTTSLITAASRTSLTLSTANEKGELHLQNRTATTSSDAGILTYYNGSNRIGAVQGSADGATDKGKLVFMALDGGSVAGRMDLTEHGLTFNGDSGAANALDDYEEGTWTPAYAAASGTITSHSNSSGFYTKVGRMVYIQGYVSYQSDSSASGTITITGLPFTSRSTGYGQSQNQAGGVASYVNALFSSNSPDGGRIPNNATLIMPFVNNATGASQLQYSDFSTSANHSQFVFFGHYFI